MTYSAIFKIKNPLDKKLIKTLSMSWDLNFVKITVIAKKNPIISVHLIYEWKQIENTSFNQLLNSAQFV